MCEAKDAMPVARIPLWQASHLPVMATWLKPAPRIVVKFLVVVAVWHPLEPQSNAVAT